MCLVKEVFTLRMRDMWFLSLIWAEVSLFPQLSYLHLKSISSIESELPTICLGGTSISCLSWRAVGQEPENQGPFSTSDQHFECKYANSIAGFNLTELNKYLMSILLHMPSPALNLYPWNTFQEIALYLFQILTERDSVLPYTF